MDEGESCRLGLARILQGGMNPLTCIATSALDSASENAVNRAIDAIVRDQNITVILAAHRLSTIAQAEHVIVLENGVVSEQGPYAILVRSFLDSLCRHRANIKQSRREGSRFRTLMAAQLLLEQSGDGRRRGAQEVTKEVESA